MYSQKEKMLTFGSRRIGVGPREPEVFQGL